MRYLAIDLGRKRTGFAVGDDVTRIVQPLHVVEIADHERLLMAIARRVDAIVWDRIKPPGVPDDPPKVDEGASR